MRNYLKSERIKQKRTFQNKLVMATPVICLILSFLLMGSGYVQTAGYNWWYILFLPFTFTYISGAIISSEKKHNYHGLFAVCEKKEKLWYAKIGIATMYLLITNVIFCVFSIACGVVWGQYISIENNVLANLILTITFAWQIPFFMLITLKSNLFFSILISVVGNLGIACICAVENIWWIPFGIPARLMCPVIGVQPNGLFVEPGSPLGESGVILPGLLLTIALYIILSVISAQIFKRQEV